MLSKWARKYSQGEDFTNTPHNFRGTVRTGKLRAGPPTVVGNIPYAEQSYMLRRTVARYDGGSIGPTDISLFIQTPSSRLNVGVQVFPVTDNDSAPPALGGTPCAVQVYGVGELPNSGQKGRLQAVATFNAPFGVSQLQPTFKYMEMVITAASNNFTFPSMINGALEVVVTWEPSPGELNQSELNRVYADCSVSNPQALVL